MRPSSKRLDFQFAGIEIVTETNRPLLLLGALVLVPVSAVLKYYFTVSPLLIFLTSAGAVAVLAEWIRRATEQLAKHAGPAIGGLLVVSFGSVAELVLALF